MPAGHAASLPSFAGSAFASVTESFVASLGVPLSAWLSGVGLVSRFGAVSALCEASAGSAEGARGAGSRSIGGAGFEPAQPTRKTIKTKGDRIAGEGSACAHSTQSKHLWLDATPLTLACKQRVCERDGQLAFGYTFGGMLRRAGLIGDIHCEVARLKRVIEHFRSLGVDSVLADGDGDLNETCALLRAEGALAVAGNHDRWLLAGEMRDLPDATRLETVTPEARRYLSTLPKTRFLESPRGPVMLCHGLGEDDMASVRPDDDCEALRGNAAFLKLLAARPARFVINGHSHRPMVRTIDGLTILNAGTLHPKHRPVCAIADFDQGEVQIYDIRGNAVTPAECWSLERGSRPIQSLAE